VQVGCQLILLRSLAQQLFQQAAAVLVVEQTESWFEPQTLMLPPQDVQSEGVEGGYLQTLNALVPEQLGHPGLHLPGSLVSEGDRNDMPRFKTYLLDQVGDLAGNDARLARPRPRQYQQRGVDMAHRFALRWV